MLSPPQRVIFNKVRLRLPQLHANILPHRPSATSCLQTHLHTNINFLLSLKSVLCPLVLFYFSYLHLCFCLQKQQQQKQQHRQNKLFVLWIALELARSADSPPPRRCFVCVPLYILIKSSQVHLQQNSKN